MADHVGREVDFQSLGKTFRAQRFERGNGHKQFVDWAHTKLPDPATVCRKEIEELALAALEIQERKDLSPIQKKALLDANLRQQHHAAEYAIDLRLEYMSIDSPQVRNLLSTDEGGVKCMQIMLSKYHPELTEKDVADIVDDIGIVKVSEILAAVSGTVPPKDQAPAAPLSSGDQSPSPGGTSTKSYAPDTPDSPPSKSTA